MSRSILVISFQYPPVQASSGLLRILAFSRDLSDFGMDVTVLTSSLVGDKNPSKENQQLIPDNVRLLRTKALDAAKNLAVFGRYPGFLEWPDRFSSWVVSAVLRGVRTVRQNDIELVFSTYPIASAHLVGYLLFKLTRKPWIADFRDPMIMQDHPDTRLRRQAHAWIESKVIKHCKLAIFTNPHARAHYARKYPHVNVDKFHVIENGYDEELFKQAEHIQGFAPRNLENDKPIKILHSGALYPNHRNPEALFKAIATLSTVWQSEGHTVNFMFRGSGYSEQLQTLVDKEGIKEWVTFGESISYIDSIAEIISSDALLLIQGESCNDQVPAKLYEYIRADKPVFALTHCDGATAAELNKYGVKINADNTSASAIETALGNFVEQLRSNREREVRKTDFDFARISRRQRSQKLYELIGGL